MFKVSWIVRKLYRPTQTFITQITLPLTFLFNLIFLSSFPHLFSTLQPQNISLRACTRPYSSLLPSHHTMLPLSGVIFPQIFTSITSTHTRFPYHLPQEVFFECLEWSLVLLLCSLIASESFLIDTYIYLLLICLLSAKTSSSIRAGFYLFVYQGSSYSV